MLTPESKRIGDIKLDLNYILNAGRLFWDETHRYGWILDIQYCYHAVLYRDVSLLRLSIFPFSHTDEVGFIQSSSWKCLAAGIMFVLEDMQPECMSFCS